MCVPQRTLQRKRRGSSGQKGTRGARPSVWRRGSRARRTAARSRRAAARTERLTAHCARARARVRLAHEQEVWAQTTDRELAHLGEELANREAESGKGWKAGRRMKL